MSTDESPEQIAESSATEAGGLGEIIPEQLMPVWRQVERVQAFRRTHGDTYVAVLELLATIVLIGGYVWWLYLFLFAG